jgi:hypothetical protein
MFYETDFQDMCRELERLGYDGARMTCGTLNKMFYIMWKGREVSITRHEFYLASRSERMMTTMAEMVDKKFKALAKETSAGSRYIDDMKRLRNRKKS